MVHLIALIAAITGFLFGFDEGIVSGVLDQITRDFGMNPRQVGFMMGLMPFGALVAAALIGRFSDFAGRRFILFLVPVLFSSGIGITIGTSSYFFLCAARVLLGVSIGMSVVISPLYIAEAAPKEIRGTLLVYFQLAITLGIFVAYCLNLFAYNLIPWRMMFAMGFVPSAVLFIGAFFIPESPRWLFAHGKIEEAKKTLRQLDDTRPLKQLVQEELASIEKTEKRGSKKGVWAELFSKNVRPCVFLGMFLFFFQQVSGINAVIYYAPIIFKNMQMGSQFASLLATVGVGGLNLFMTIVSMKLIEKVGRRPLLMVGFAGAAVSLCVVALITYLNIPDLRWIGAVALFTYVGAFAVGLGPLPWVMMPEIFPMKVRGQGASISAASNWAFNTIVVGMFPILLSDFGISLTFILFAVTCVIGLFFTIRYVPETQGMSLEEIEKHIQSKEPLRLLGRNR